MRAEAYLDRIKKLDAMIRNKRNDYDRWKDIARGLGGSGDGERVQSARNLQKTADAVIAYVDIESEIKRLEAERQSILRTIEELPFLEYDVIYRLYVGDETMKEIAYRHDKSYEWVKLKKKSAFRHIEAMLTITQT